MKLEFKSCKKIPIFITLLGCFFGFIARIDHLFFKTNHSFCVRFLYSCLPRNPHWDLPPVSSEELQQLDTLLDQPFYYLGKGCHCYAFISQDDQFVIKFHRFASHMRMFPWLNHPFSYLFNEKRKKIKQHNIDKLHYNLQNYKNTFLDLKSEAGLLLLHINRSCHLNRSITLVDRTGAIYRVPLDEVTFIIQKKADLIYPTLEKLYASGQLAEGKKVISSVLQLILDSHQKGYVDHDPILRKNYGLLGLEAMHIDIGDLVKESKIEARENDAPYVKRVTASLRKKIEADFPLLLSHYDEKIKQITLLEKTP